MVSSRITFGADLPASTSIFLPFRYTCNCRDLTTAVNSSSRSISSRIARYSPSASNNFRCKCEHILVVSTFILHSSFFILHSSIFFLHSSFFFLHSSFFHSFILSTCYESISCAKVQLFYDICKICTKKFPTIRQFQIVHFPSFRSKRSHFSNTFFWKNLQIPLKSCTFALEKP